MVYDEQVVIKLWNKNKKQGGKNDDKENNYEK